MSDQQQVPLDEVLKLIECEVAVWLRVAVLRDGDEWRPALFDMTTGVQPARWIERSWDYDEARFESTKASGPEVCHWISDGKVVFGDVRVTLPSVHDPAQAERHQSRHAGVYETLGWPVTEYTLNWPDMKRGSGVGPLVGDHSPSFFQFQAAAAYFFGVELTGRSIENGPWMLRRQETFGRIKVVRLKPTGTEVTVEGKAIADMVVELASDVPGPTGVLPVPRTSNAGETHGATVEFPGELARNAWVLLRRDRTWIDRRFLNWGFRTTADEGIEQAVEPEEQLEALVSTGEGSSVEFKVELPPPQATTEQLRFLRTVAAFANGDGGTVLFGITDDGEVVGLTKTDAGGGAKDRITNLVRANVVPLPEYAVDLFDIEGKPDRVVLVLRVEAGPAPPYGVKPGNPSYYLRRGATTFPASAEQVRALARSRPSMARQIALPSA